MNWNTNTLCRHSQWHQSDLPFGHYSTNGLVAGGGLQGTLGPDDYLGLGEAGYNPASNGGWLFEPRSELVQAAQLIPTVHSTCEVVVRFNYIGANKSSFNSFQAAGVESECLFPNPPNLNGTYNISACGDLTPSSCSPKVLCRGTVKRN